MLPEPEKKGPWFILTRVPNLVEDDDGVISPTTDLAFLLHRPPGTTILSVPRRLAPQGTTDIDYPYVAATDEHGDFLLLCSRRLSGLSEYLVWLRTHRPEDGDQFVPTNHPGDGGLHLDYFICDTSTKKAYRLPQLSWRWWRCPRPRKRGADPTRR
ncbi:hypothetical protein PR202_gb26790 [Eleusine coracana subsp. coracana]|uniref:Uncharacterized protein n=1 Tax=Eleusine coracana subsp. coracana TaxID=191504 RepID=A0AAV5FU70_ELECO|nr:hypothetical protein PR202_gb26790 [Eleusine coracana subsp. coracana]